MATTRREHPRELPSYARPTATSASKTSPRQLSDQPPSPTVRRFPLHSPLRREVYRSYSLSTRASYLKDRSQGRFRLMDLPLELRERIYELVYPKHQRHRLHLCDPVLMETNLEHLPALLRVNQQIRDEAGRYFFSHHSFDFLIQHNCITTLFDWFATIGRPNAERLLSNRRVTIRIQHDPKEYHRMRGLDHRHREANTITGTGAVDVMSLNEVFDQVQMTSTRPIAIRRWKFVSESPSAAKRFLDPAPHILHVRSRHNRRSTPKIELFSLAILTQMRSIILGSLDMLQGGEMKPATDQGDGENWLRADEHRMGRNNEIPAWRTPLSSEHEGEKKTLLIYP